MYGAMSFTDKLANGVAIQIIQLCHPCNQKNEYVQFLCQRELVTCRKHMMFWGIVMGLKFDGLLIA